MPEQIALAICCIFILWLYMRGRKSCPMTSKVLWIPLLWVMVIGSRPVASWFGARPDIESPDYYLEGSPVDRSVYLALIIVGLVVLLTRRVNWRRMFASNRWVFLFIIYCGISVAWSDYPFVSFKRWIKDAGNFVMIFIILTETSPGQALRAVFVRYAYIALPFSVLLILYFPAIGTYNHGYWDASQDRLAYEAWYCGIAEDKNGLGCITFVSGLFLIWDFFESRAGRPKKPAVVDLFSSAALMSMVIWLIVSAHSATALTCLALGAGIFLIMRLPIARTQARHLGMYSLAACLLALAVYAVFSFSGILETLVGTLGRDLTFTGRTEMWADVLSVPINPVIGTGYMSFWQGPWVQSWWMTYSLVYMQAHNGYLETYLNGGVIGLGLLLALIAATGSKLKRALIEGSPGGALLFSFFITILFYNWTEAKFSGDNLIWFILLLIALSYRRSPGPASEATW